MKRRGFTLVELLTVIAIIVILIGILIPTVSSVRRSAYQSSTQATISNLIASLERYRSDFNAYPGAIRNTDFDQAAGTASASANAMKMTMTESMVLALVGGWEPGTTGAVYNSQMVGLGPMSFNPILASRRRYAAYADATEGKNFPTRSPSPPTPPDFPAYGPNASPPIPVSASSDTVIPEFMDAFSEPLPIIYIRANVGAAGVESPAGSAQYNSNMLKPYTRPRTPLDGSVFKGDFQLNVANDTEDFGSPDEYFRDPNLPTQPRQKDGFWLISAGPDRRFGTRDDQTNFGGFR